MELNFCRRCGAKTAPASETSYRCSKGHILFVDPAVGVGVFLLDSKDRILLSVRAREPEKGSLDAFGGFLEEQETFEEALQRELREELDIAPDAYSTPTYLTSAVSVYHYDGEDRSVVSALYYAFLSPGIHLKPQDDVADVHRTSIGEVDYSLLGGEDIKSGLRYLEKLMKTDRLSRPVNSRKPS